MCDPVSGIAAIGALLQVNSALNPPEPPKAEKAPKADRDAEERRRRLARERARQQGAARTGLSDTNLTGGLGSVGSGNAPSNTLGGA